MISDFEECIQILKNNFPNSKILFIKAYNSSQESVEMINFADIQLYWELDYICKLLGIPTANSFDEIKDLIIQTLITGDESKGIDAKITIMKQDSDELMEQIQIATNKWKIEFLDVGEYISLEEGKHLQEDYKHLNEKGYQELIPYIVDKVKNMISK